MLELHSRAARMSNTPEENWLQFALGHFAGSLEVRTSIVTLEVRQAERISELEVVLRGLLQFSHGTALPMVRDFEASLDLQARESTLQAGEQQYRGRYSENGRVLQLSSSDSKGRAPKIIYLVHEGTRRELEGG